MLSQGVPMLWRGDEFGHTQQGNNNTGRWTPMREHCSTSRRG